MAHPDDASGANPSSVFTVGGSQFVLPGAGALAGLRENRPFPARATHRYETRTMGTCGQVLIVGDDSTSAARSAALAFEIFHRVDRTMSNWTQTSEVARLNREAARGEVAIEPEVALVVAESLRLWAISEGTFDITLEPLVRLWGFLGGSRAVPDAAAIARAFAAVGSERVRLDRTAHERAHVRPGDRLAVRPGGEL